MKVPLLMIFARHFNSPAANEGESADGISSKRIVYLSHADHYVFLSNEADVLREVDAFLNKLP